MSAQLSNRVSILIGALVLVTQLALAAGCSTSPAEHSDQRSFADPESAARALAAAARNGNTPELLAILGPDGKDVLSSGDPVADRMNRQVFVVAWEEQWKLEGREGKSRELVIGHEQWPFPIPLVKVSSGWQFDTAAGKQEVLARRIGRNELAAIGVCNTYVIAQKQYAGAGHDGKPSGIYAQKVRSEPGKHDGLHWIVSKPGETPSPLSEFAAQATAEGYSAAPTKQLTPFHGYYFRILTRQGKDAPGGAMNYIVNGEMKTGFALIAYPAEYGNSGIMTFMVGQDGAVYESDLGPGTMSTAGQITEYNPDDKWRKLG